MNVFTLSATYGDHLTIPDRSLLASLAVYYDVIWLPFPFGFSDRGPVIMIDQRNPEEGATFDRERETYSRWMEQWKPLFDEGILKTIEPSSIDAQWWKVIPPSEMVYHDRIKLMSPADPESDKGIPACRCPWVADGALALAVHAKYTRKPSPELFSVSPADALTEELSALLAQSLFRIEVPMLGELEPEQILDTRMALRHLKQGFTAYLFELTEELRDAIETRERPNDVVEAFIKARFIPQYAEFERVLGARRGHMLQGAARAASDVLHISGTLSTLVFAAKILSAFARLVGVAASQLQEDLTNRGLAYQYLTQLKRRTRG